MATSTISAKGWIVIPKEIRQRYGLKAGDKVQVVDYAGSIAVIPALKDPIHQMKGMFKRGPSLTKALLEERRKERELEERKLRRWTGKVKAS